MGLLNFIALLSQSESLDKFNYQERLLYNYKKTLNLKNNLLHLKSSGSRQTKIKSSKMQNICIANESIYRFSKSHTFNPVLLQELMNQYWEQTLFFSVSTPNIQKYINQLSKQETLLIKSKKKKLLIDFSKALLYRYIDISIVNTNNMKALNNMGSLQYTWRKGFNIEAPKYIDGIWKNKKSHDFPNKTQHLILKNLAKNNFPVFTVVNGFKQLVVAEPSDQLINRNHLINSLYEWYYDRFLWTKDLGGIYEGWFFINPKDAQEYKNYITDKYTRSTKQHHLGVAASGIDFFYNLNRTAPPRTEFRLFPDLEEVANLLTKREYKSNLIFDKNQKYGRSYFQGQPIYIIEPITCSKKNSSESILLHYSYQKPDDNRKTNYNAIFLNRKIALQAWHKFYQNNPEYNLPTQPTLRVYNLEDFLRDHEDFKDLSSNEFLLIPGEDAYRYVASQYSESKNRSNIENLNKYFHTYLLTSKLWLQRVIWSLTSRQPPNW